MDENNICTIYKQDTTQTWVIKSWLKGKNRFFVIQDVICIRQYCYIISR